MEFGKEVNILPNQVKKVIIIIAQPNGEIFCDKVNKVIERK